MYVFRYNQLLLLKKEIYMNFIAEIWRNTQKWGGVCICLEFWVKICISVLCYSASSAVTLSFSFSFFPFSCNLSFLINLVVLFMFLFLVEFHSLFIGKKKRKKKNRRRRRSPEKDD